jgi:hypothetical protein
LCSLHLVWRSGRSRCLHKARNRTLE